MNNEDLYREIQSQEEEDDHRFKQNQAPKELKKLPRKEPDYLVADARFQKDFVPVFEARRRVLAGLPPTSNPFRNAWLKMTGQDKIPDVEVVDPTKGLVLHGPTVDDVAKEIAANPEAYRHLAKVAPSVQPTQAERRSIEPKLANEPRDDA